MFLIVVFGSQERVLTVPDDCDLSLLKQILGSEFAFSPTELQLEYASMTLQPGALSMQAVGDGATITVHRRPFSVSDIPQNATPAELLQIAADHPQILQQIQPELAALLERRNEAELRMWLMRQAMRGVRVVFERQQEEAKLRANPDDPENQRKMLEIIQREAVEEAHHMAMEHNPEVFASVSMLYINVTINGCPLKAFVDSGAQMTIMSQECADRCGILRLMDTRYAGVAAGVGTGKILGRIHMVQLQFGQSYFPVSITVLESNSMECLFGLDTLKRYRCCIDLKRNVLRLEDGTTGAEEVPFLAEHEIPANAREEAMETDKAVDPAAAATTSAPGSAAAEDDAVGNLAAAVGVSREVASAALQQCGGSLDEAAALLFASK